MCVADHDHERLAEIVGNAGREPTQRPSSGTAARSCSSCLQGVKSTMVSMTYPTIVDSRSLCPMHQEPGVRPASPPAPKPRHP